MKPVLFSWPAAMLLIAALPLIHFDCAESDRNPVIEGQLTISPP